MASVIAFAGSIALIAMLLAAAWSTERRRSLCDGEPTLEEHAAADAGRVGAVAATGPHDAVGVGAPTHLDEVVR